MAQVKGSFILLISDDIITSPPIVKRLVELFRNKLCKLHAVTDYFDHSTRAMAQRLKDKVAVVTGSSSGLGRAIALAYSHEGAAVVCADLQPEARLQLSAKDNLAIDEVIRQGGGRAVFVRTDVSSAHDFQNLVKEAVTEFGRIDM